MYFSAAQNFSDFFSLEGQNNFSFLPSRRKKKDHWPLFLKVKRIESREKSKYFTSESRNKTEISCERNLRSSRNFRGSFAHLSRFHNFSHYYTVHFFFVRFRPHDRDRARSADRVQRGLEPRGVVRVPQHDVHQGRRRRLDGGQIGGDARDRSREKSLSATRASRHHLMASPRKTILSSQQETVRFLFCRQGSKKRAGLRFNIACVSEKKRGLKTDKRLFFLPLSIHSCDDFLLKFNSRRICRKNEMRESDFA